MEFVFSLINIFNKEVSSSNYMGSIMLVILDEININNILVFFFGKY